MRESTRTTDVLTPSVPTGRHADAVARAFPRFVHDALEFARGSLTLLTRLLAESTPDDAAQLAELYRRIHSLKGSSAMVQGHSLDARRIVEMLNQLESHLSTTPPARLLAERQAWAPHARETLERVYATLERVDRALQSTGSSRTHAAPDRLGTTDESVTKAKRAQGWVVRLHSGERCFVPLDQIACVLSPAELGSGRELVYQGLWIPVIRGSLSERASHAQGLVLRERGADPGAAPISAPASSELISHRCVVIEEVERQLSVAEALAAHLRALPRSA